MEGNWIKLHRKAIDSRVFSDAGMWHLWCWCLLRASWKRSWWRDREVGPGEFITSAKSAAADLNISESTFRRRIKKLKEYGCVETVVTNKFTHVSICNWGTYQHEDIGMRRSSGDQAAHKRRTTGDQAVTVEEGKELKEGKESQDVYDDDGEDLLELATDLVAEWNRVASGTGAPGFYSSRGLTNLEHSKLDAANRVGGLDRWREALERIAKSEYACGRKMDFRASLGWFLDQDRIPRILEGQYDDFAERSKAEGKANGAGYFEFSEEFGK